MDASMSAAPRPFCVVSRQVPAELVARARTRFELETAGDEPALPGWYLALLLPRADRDRLREAFDQNPFVTAELTESGGALVDRIDDWLGAPPVEPGFYLSLTTGTAYGLQCAVLVCEELERRGALPPERRSNVELCLHEAVANAIVHGNLGIPSAAKNQPQGYRLFNQLVVEKLGDPAITSRRLDIFCRWNAKGVVIAVVDQGAGFDAQLAPAAVSGKARSGRGFVFMRALASRVTVTDGGRCTLLQFDL